MATPRASGSSSPPKAARPPVKRYVLNEGPPGVLVAPKPPRKKGRWITGALGAFLVLVGAGVTVVLLMPGCIKRKAIEAAAARGITLTIEDVTLGTSHVVLRQVTAVPVDLPTVRVSAEDVDVETSGFSADAVVVKNADIAIDGPMDEARVAYAKLRTTHASATGGAHPLPKITLDQAKLHWEHALGNALAARLDAAGIHVEIDDKGGDADVMLVAPRVTLTTSAGVIGPWRIGYDRSGTTSRFRLAFDPEVPDTPNALVVSDVDTISQLDVTIPRSPLSRLNVPTLALGLPKDDPTQLEAKVHFVHPRLHVVDGQAHVGLYGLKFGPTKVPLDVVLDAKVTGTDAALEVKDGQLAIGRLHAAITGGVKVENGNFRLELASHAGPLDCATFLRPPPPPPGLEGAPGVDVLKGLQQLAEATGIAKITGNIQIDVHVVVDSRDLAHPKVDFVPKHDCSVSLFGN